MSEVETDEISRKSYQFTYSGAISKDGKQYTKEHSFTETELRMYLSNVFGWAVTSYQAIEGEVK